MLQLALVAPRPVPRKQTITRTQDRSRKSRFSIQASRTLSENLPPGNYCVKVDRLVRKPMAVAEGQGFWHRIARRAKFPEQQSDDDQRVDDNTFHLEEARSMNWLVTPAISLC
jgi:hypothetical protein